MYFRLNDDMICFPDPALADDDGLLAIGGKLTPSWLLTSYSYGIFPWYSIPDIGPAWYCPHERFVIFPDEIHISHSMRQLIRKQQYRVTVDEAFDHVIESCSRAQGRNKEDGAWLVGDFLPAYKLMHQLGFATSIEVWLDDKLVGGLYGIKIGKNVNGESMFSLAPSASKLALIKLAEIVGAEGGIIDCQFETPHLKSMGGRYISYAEYMKYFEGWYL